MLSEVSTQTLGNPTFVNLGKTAGQLSQLPFHAGSLPTLQIDYFIHRFFLYP